MKRIRSLSPLERLDSSNHTIFCAYAKKIKMEVRQIGDIPGFNLAQLYFDLHPLYTREITPKELIKRIVVDYIPLQRSIAPIRFPSSIAAHALIIRRRKIVIEFRHGKTAQPIDIKQFFCMHSQTRDKNVDLLQIFHF